jgi:hypothetical protein
MSQGGVFEPAMRGVTSHNKLLTSYLSLDKYNVRHVEGLFTFKEINNLRSLWKLLITNLSWWEKQHGKMAIFQNLLKRHVEVKKRFIEIT